MINLSQNLRLEQRLTPQQILLSTLLQLPLLSLEQKIKSELEINPVLEEGDEEDEQLQEDIIESTEEEIAEVEEELELHEKKSDKDDDYDRKEIEDAQKDNDLENFLNDEDAYEIRLPKDKNDDDYERPEISQKTLPEHLLEQMHILNLDEKELAIGEYLIWNIRDDGYLDQSISVDTVSEIFEVEIAQVEKILSMIRSLEPTGVGSRDLRECLLVQIYEIENPNKIAIEILKDYFDDFKNRRYDKILDGLKITSEELQAAIDQVLRLNPKPGEGMFDSRSNYIVPDFIVEEIDGEFVVSLNDWNIPPLKISSTYKKMLFDRKSTDKETRHYIRKKIESARWFITSIYQRKMTMLKVMEAILQKQIDFFRKGADHIRPLIMREIAEMIEMDISTVSRVANGKYVQTDFGVFELKYFFNERIETDDGDEISTRMIKNRIRDIIEEEDHKKPYSDDKLSVILKKEGFPVARRTVAKYREQLQIPVARLRRGL